MRLLAAVAREKKILRKRLILDWGGKKRGGFYEKAVSGFINLSNCLPGVFAKFGQSNHGLLSVWYRQYMVLYQGKSKPFFKRSILKRGVTMKKTFLIIFSLLILVSCATSPGNKNDAVQSILMRSFDYYEGDGGKGIRLAVLRPGFEDPADIDNWVPLYIQGILTRNINILSEITVLDRQNIEQVLSEQNLSASGYFSEEDYIRIGNITNAQYILIGTINKISTVEISLQLSITNTESGERKASFIKVCVLDDIKNASVLNEATVQLLSFLDVNLTERGKNALFSSKISTNSAETSLAKGIIAQKNGTMFEAMSYYYDATAFDPSLLEAQTRLSTIKSDFQSGNIGIDARNDIENRDLWLSMLQECEKYFAYHLPVEIIYNPKLTQNDIDYESKTVNLAFDMGIRQSSNTNLIQNLLISLKKPGREMRGVLPIGRLHQMPSLIAGIPTVPRASHY
jgi:hypothetical protein